MKEKIKEKRNFIALLTTHPHLAPMAYHSAHPNPKDLFIKTMP